MYRYTNLIIKIISVNLFISLICLNIFVVQKFIKINKSYDSSKSYYSNYYYDNLDKFIVSLIDKLSDNEKIGQLILINYYGDDLNKLKELLNDYGITGVMLRSDNFKNKNYGEIKNINAKIIDYSSRIPCFIAVDQEGGSVSRLSGIIKNYPNPFDLYKKEGVEGIKKSAEYFAEKLRDLNITVNFAPVVDIVLNTNSIVNKRSFSSDPFVNSELAKIYLEIFNKYNLIAVPKHYPGYGNVEPDPHFDVCIDNTSEIDKIAIPFFNLLDSFIIMSSHVIYSKYDEKPATLSEKVISYIRRKNYSNIIITDDIQMKAITKIYDYKEASLMAINAGCDIVLCVSSGPSDWYKNAVDLHKYLLDAYKKGKLKKENVYNSLERILKLKLKLYKNEQWCLLSPEEKNFINNYNSLLTLMRDVNNTNINNFR